MSVNDPRLADLLRAAAHGARDLRLGNFDDRAVRWAVATGLGPLLYHVTRDDDRREASPLWSRVHSAYLTARLVGTGQHDAIAEIIDGCAERGCTLTLLKGSAIARLYPEPGLRPMRDVDLLAPEPDVPLVESVLTALGYRQWSEASPDFYESHHHTMPFFDARRDVWIEVHHRLASPRHGRAVEEVLGPEHVAANLEPMDFRGRRATRLTHDMELIYIATHWGSRFQTVGGAIPLLDVTYLVKSGLLRWDRVLAWLERAPATAAHLYALLTYLAARRLTTVAPDVLDALARRQQSFGAASLRIVHALIDRFLLDGAAPGRLVSEARLRIIWNTLVQPGPQAGKLAALPWRLLPRAPGPTS